MDAETLSKLAKLPWDVQIVLGSGYLAYLLAYVGIRQHHKPVDSVFLTVAFGLVAVLALWVTSSLILPARMVIALSVSLLAAVVWRKFGRSGLRAVFRSTGFSWADETTSAMDHLQENDRHHPRQLCVETTDGYTFFCSNTEPVGELPFGPYVIGCAGDVLMYADQSQAPGADVPAPVEGVFHEEWGANITYIPAGQIRRIAIRFAPPPQRKDREPTSAAEAGHWMVRVKGVAASMLRRLGRVPE